MEAREVNSRRMREAIVGIDIGSANAKCCVVAMNANGKHDTFPVENTTWDFRRDNPGDFPAFCAPFEDDPLQYIGGAAYPKPRHVSIKYLMYLLSGVEDRILKHYPISSELREWARKPMFQSTALTILEKFVAMLKEAIVNVCQRNSLLPRKIVICTPPHWGRKFERIYEHIFANVFPEIDTNDMLFCGESEGLAHYMMHSQCEELRGDLTNRGSPWDVVLCLDCGGHSASGTIYELERDEDGRIKTFVEIDTKAAPGGSEMWKFLSQQEYFKTEEKFPANGDSRIFKRVGRWVEKFTDWMLNGATQIEDLDLQLETINQCYTKAFEGVILLSERLINTLVACGSPNMGIIATGGSVVAGEVRRHLIDYCTQRNIPIKFADQLGMASRSTAVCQGAAVSCTYEPRPVEETLKHDMAMGIEMKKQPPDQWGEAVPLWPLEESAKGETIVHYTDECKRRLLICPNYSTTVDRSELTWYPIYNLSVQKKPGRYKIKTELTTENAQSYVTLTETPLNNTGRRNKITNNLIKPTVTKLPLFFRNQNLAVHVDDIKLVRMAEDQCEAAQVRPGERHEADMVSEVKKLSQDTPLQMTTKRQRELGALPQRRRKKRTRV
ncbi:hypothetical protein NKR23_g10947 [Pleurostoma richardsiae]|uniref:Actin-like ATPase domain-containing protein n=1 Tax=Pleurostoma richardsiae TaxID=41990 RepID=A0AA38VHV7_9PEZI|nr:hypothetical protein NKR23_g10947 [Pleurostoma richardsiae]